MRRIALILTCFILVGWLTSCRLVNPLPSDASLIREYRAHKLYFDKIDDALSRADRRVFECEENTSDIQIMDQMPNEATSKLRALGNIGTIYTPGTYESLACYKTPAIYFERKAVKGSGFGPSLAKGYAFLPFGLGSSEGRWLVEDTDSAANPKPQEVILFLFKQIQGDVYVYKRIQPS